MTLSGPIVCSPVTSTGPETASSPSNRTGTKFKNPLIPPPPGSSQFSLVAFQPRSSALCGRHVCSMAVVVETIVISRHPPATKNDAETPPDVSAVAANWSSDVIPPFASMIVYVPGMSKRASTATGSAAPAGSSIVPDVLSIAPSLLGFTIVIEAPSANTRFLSPPSEPSTIASPVNLYVPSIPAAVGLAPIHFAARYASMASRSASDIAKSNAMNSEMSRPPERASAMLESRTSLVR